MTISGATYREGVAYSPDGAMYVQLAPGSSVSNPTFTGVALFADGTSSAPSIAFAASTGTGFFRQSSGGNSIVISLGTTPVARVFSSVYQLNGAVPFGWCSGDPTSTSPDAAMARAGLNSVIFGGISGLAAGAVTSRTELNKAVASIADNSATAVLTVTIPNGAHSASLTVKLKGSLGAGGAIGANEATESIIYGIDIARTAGVNAVATIGTGYGGTTGASVAGGAAITVTGAISAISGAVGATNTFTVNVTIARGSGSSTNHTCFVYAQLINDNASGVTIA